MINTGKIPHIENDEIRIVGTKPSMHYIRSPIGREIVAPHAGQ